MADPPDETVLSGVSGVTSGVPDETDSVRRFATGATIAQNFPVDADGLIPGTVFTDTLTHFTVGFNARSAEGEGTFTVHHELRMTPDGAWFEDGTDSTLVSSHITTIAHRALQYRPVIDNESRLSATLDVEQRGS